jgi:hypothetical protein
VTVTLTLYVYVERRKQAAVQAQRAASLRAIGAAILLYSQSVSPSQANLKTLFGALSSYASRNDGRFPTNLQMLVDAKDIQLDPSALLSPGGPGSRRYIYCGAGLMNDADVYAVLAYEPLAPDGSGIWVLFANGMVRHLSAPVARPLVAELESGHNPPRTEKIK